MDLLLTILKFAGAFVSGFGAIIAAIPDSRRGKRSEKSKLKQVWHKLNTKQPMHTRLHLEMVHRIADSFLSGEWRKIETRIFVADSGNQIHSNWQAEHAG